ncbi:MAG: lipoprotein [Spiroplasma sp. hy2]|uniref:lipoprotein n=1 Tax=Spiroplasma sp. hy2 TaxID=2490850 RepID=UPI0038455212
MKKILSLLGTITLIGTSTTSLVACDNIVEYTPEELTKLKEENNISLKDGILEWMAPQERPFNEVDNKYYYVVWKGNNQWNINKFKNDEFPKQIIPNNNGKDKILINYGDYTVIQQRLKELYFVYRDSLKIKYWSYDKEGIYFKSVYRWNLYNNEPNLVIDKNGNVKVDGE